MSETIVSPLKIPHPDRISVHNATGAKIEAGSVVRLTGTETDGVPNIEKTDGLHEVPIGVTYEDIEDGKKGVVLVRGIVEVIVNADVTQGAWAGLSTVPGRVENLEAGPLTPGAGATVSKTRGIVGIFIGGAGAQSPGDKVRLLLNQGMYFDSSTGT